MEDQTSTEQASPDPSPVATGNDVARQTPPATSESAPKNVPPLRGPKKRTKTGCLTCRRRRIKCGEEKPTCKNCIKSKRECQGYNQRVIFKHPMGPIGGFRPGELTGTDLQQLPLGIPLYNQHQRRLPGAQPTGSQQRLLAPRPPTQVPTTGPTGPTGPHSSLEVNGQPFCPPTTYGAAAELIPPITARPIMAPALKDQHRQNVGVESVSVQSLYQQQFSYQDHVGPPMRPTEISLPYATHMELARTLPYHSTPLTEVMSPHIAYEDEADEGYDEMELGDDTEEQTQAEGFNQMSLIVASATQDESQLRSFTTFLNEPNVLAFYRPSIGSTPLNNPKTARIWVHFIHATGPSLSIWERHPTNPSALFGEPVPPAQQGLWTYTMPLKALEHPELLQALLAISSLHIAKLQHSPLTTSSKHYHFALRRLRKSLGLPLRRKQIPTLAATLVLAFFEVMAAEHSKWDTHVAGATQLIKETDFAGMTKDLRAYRRRVMQQRSQMAYPSPWLEYGQLGGGISDDDPFAEKEADISQDLIGALMGRAVNYDEFGQIEDEGQCPKTPRKHFTKKDIENFRIQCDLYWFYCKHDVFQSMISGNRLYTPFDRWGQCPPRAGLGKLDAIYGSMDHLVLLLARLMDFCDRDRQRKLKVLETTGGEWKPNSGFYKFMARFGHSDSRGRNAYSQPFQTPSTAPTVGVSLTRSKNMFPSDDDFNNRTHGADQTATPNLNSDQPTRFQDQGFKKTQMYGMVPSHGPAPLPPGFADSAYTSDPTTRDNEKNLRRIPESDCEAEWESIRVAFDVLIKGLGPDFDPLPPDSTTPISTPFGPAVQYRTHTIAAFWGFYYSGRIILHRVHPSMPPAAMVAAGVAASTTAQYAQKVGKITAGIYYPQRYNLEAGSLNPNLGAALTEVTVPLFFAGVQYTDRAQRGWTVAKLRDISRLTGWQSASAIAAGCETAWCRSAELGGGPPYEYTRKGPGEEKARHVSRSQEADWQVSTEPNNDRRFVTVNKSLRSHWAMGLLELENDFVNLHVVDHG